MQTLLLTRRAKTVAVVVAGALVVGGCAGTALALRAQPPTVVEGWLGDGDGLERYLLTMAPAAAPTPAVQGSRVPWVLASATTGVPAPLVERLGDGGQLVQLGSSTYYVTARGGLPVDAAPSQQPLSAEEVAQWAAQLGVPLELPGGLVSDPDATPSVVAPTPEASAAEAPEPSGPVTDAQLDALEAAPGVVSAQRVDDFVLVAGTLTIEQARELPGVVAVERSAAGELLGTLSTDDPLARDHGWHLENTGYAYGQAASADADVDAADGWAAGTGEGTIIAVVDSGYDTDHEDLAGQLWTNPGCATDADRDGISGDCHGWNFYANSADLDQGGGNNSLHGTHVSGLAAAAGGNGVGSTGLAPGAKVMPLVIGSQSSVDVNLGIRPRRG